MMKWVRKLFFYRVIVKKGKISNEERRLHTLQRRHQRG